MDDYYHLLYRFSDQNELCEMFIINSCNEEKGNSISNDDQPLENH